MRFVKMHGAGNDYVYVDCFRERVDDPPALARWVSDRHFGIGSDGLVLILPPEGREADFRMRMFNADGSEAEMCGNAIRCVGKYVRESGLTLKDELGIETLAGLKVLHLQDDGASIASATVDMGIPAATGGFVHVAGVEAMPVSMGNPHVVLFVEDVSAARVATLGPLIECDPLFPDRTNVEFLAVQARDRLDLRVWERGTGETLACGTGACAAAVAAVLAGEASRKTEVRVPGGSLSIEWREDDGHVYLTGPAEESFRGEFSWPRRKSTNYGKK